MASMSEECPAGSYRAICYGVPVISDVPLTVLGGAKSELQAPCRIVIERSSPPSMRTGQALIELEIQGRKVSSRFAPDHDDETHRGVWRAFVENVARFEWREGPDEPLRIWRDGASDEILAFWVVHLLLPAFLSCNRGISILHASAVEVEGGCVAFLGPSFSGKSTLLASFLERGFALYCDDKLAIRPVEGGIRAFAAHERYRPYRATESLGRCQARRVADPGPVRALLALERIAGLEKPEIVPVSGADAFRRLIADHHMGFWQSRAENFQAVSHLSRTVPLATLAIPDDLRCLPAVNQAVEDYVRTL